MVIVGLVPLLGEKVNSLKQTLSSVPRLVGEAQLSLQVVDIFLHLLQKVRPIRIGFCLQALDYLRCVPVLALGLLGLESERGSLVGEEGRERSPSKRRTCRSGRGRGIAELLEPELGSELLDTEGGLEGSDGRQGQFRAQAWGWRS